MPTTAPEAPRARQAAICDPLTRPPAASIGMGGVVEGGRVRAEMTDVSRVRRGSAVEDP